LAEFDRSTKENAEKLEAAKRKELMEMERKIIDESNEREASASSNASRIREQAEKKKADIMRKNAEETKALEDKLSTQRKTKEGALKKRLEERRAAKLQGIKDPNAAQAEEIRIAHDDYDDMLKFQEETAAAEAAERERAKALQEQKIADAIAEVKKAELAAAVFAAREQAMKTLKDQQSQLVQESNQKEAVEKRSKALALAEANEEDAQRQKALNKAKMGDRLAAKRLKKEKEMKEQEEVQLAELKRNQQLEAEAKKS